MPIVSRRLRLPCVCSSAKATEPRNTRSAPPSAAAPVEAVPGRPGKGEQGESAEGLAHIEAPSTTTASTELDSRVPESFTSPTEGAAPEGGLLQMSGDRLCIRTMDVAFIDGSGQYQSISRTGYNCTVYLPASAQDIEMSFSVLGGGKVCKVDRDHPEMPWLRDEQGRIIETFSYPTVPQHVQFFLRGPSLHSYVSHVDMRHRTENLVELVSLDFHCVRTMLVSYTDVDGSKQQWSKGGYNVKFHIPIQARDVEVTFSVVGGADIHRVDRRLPGMPWIEDANAERPLERFRYPSPPSCVQYEARGSSLKCYICRVREQHSNSEHLAGDDFLASHPLGDPVELFQETVDKVPAVGGLIDLRLPHSDFLLPAQVALFEPSQNEIFSSRGPRQIFLNTLLTESEVAALGELHKTVAAAGNGGPNGQFPRYMGVHALRMLQSSKFKIDRVEKLMDFVAKERVTRLPLEEQPILQHLQRGFIYWHGRDRWCRPLMVLRMERIGDMLKDKETAMRVVVFALEYALRFCMVPGRVENWVVLLDLANILNIISPMQIGNLLSTAAAVGKTLEQVYCGRMVWVKIVNMPGGDFLRKSVNSAIPSEKREKVSFCRDVAAELRDKFEPNQLEQRYGGSAPDVQQGEAYPYRFFPDCRGALEARHLYHAEAGSGSVEPEEFSLHEATSLDFHEGLLWDTSTAEAKAGWMAKVQSLSLPPLSSDALARMPGGAQVRPCNNAVQWLSIVSPSMGSVRSSSKNALLRRSCGENPDENDEPPMPQRLERLPEGAEGAGSENDDIN